MTAVRSTKKDLSHQQSLMSKLSFTLQAARASSIALVTGCVRILCTINGTRRVRQLELGCESS